VPLISKGFLLEQVEENSRDNLENGRGSGGVGFEFNCVV